ncbi:hypothetical protein LXL04_022822 [Taraxacum kok-saghyz]
MVNRIMDALKSHVQVSGYEGRQEVEKIAVSFEENVYVAATSQNKINYTYIQTTFWLFKLINKIESNFDCRIKLINKIESNFSLNHRFREVAFADLEKWPTY